MATDAATNLEHALYGNLSSMDKFLPPSLGKNHNDVSRNRCIVMKKSTQSLWTVFALLR